MRSLSAFGEGFKAVAVKREKRRRHKEGMMLEDRVGNMARKMRKDEILETSREARCRMNIEEMAIRPDLYILHCSDSR